MSVHFLGHIVSKEGVRTNPEKVAKIQNWPKPQTFKQLHSFIGFANYYRRFIKQFSDLIRPLQDLLQDQNNSTSKKNIVWNTKAEECFLTVKNCLCTDPVLALPEPKATFILDTDASCSAVGAVLSQIVNGEERVLFYASNSLSKTEQNYCTTRRELLAIVKYLKYFRHYLLGQQFILRTDHKSLTWLMNWKDPSSCQYFSWIEEIQQYNFEIQHRSGKEHVNADMLSRLPQCSQCQIKHIEPRPQRMAKQARQTSKTDDLFELKEFCKKNITIDLIKGNAFYPYLEYIRLENNKLIYNKAGTDCMVISNQEGKLLANKMHSFLAHIGFCKLFNTLRNNFFWLDLKKDVHDAVTQCKYCLQRKDVGQMKHLKKSIEAEYPFQKIFIDITGPLPTSKNNARYILAIVDGFSKWTSLIALKTESALEVTNAILSRWISIFGPPEKIHSDRGTNFTSKHFQDMCIEYGIRKTFSSPYYPMGNSIVERQFKTIKDLLFCTCNENGTDWEQSLWKIEQALRISYNVNNEASPYELIFQRQPRIPNSLPKSEDQAKTQSKLITLFNKKCKKNSQNKLHQCKFRAGEKVFAKILPARKGIYEAKYEGPYIIERVKGSSLVLKNLCNEKIITRNEHHVKRYTGEWRHEKQVYIHEPSFNESSQSSNGKSQSRSTRRYPSRLHQKPKKLGHAD